MLHSINLLQYVLQLFFFSFSQAVGKYMFHMFPFALCLSGKLNSFISYRDLRQNFLTGPISPSIGNLTSLQYL